MLGDAGNITPPSPMETQSGPLFEWLALFVVYWSKTASCKFFVAQGPEGDAEMTEKDKLEQNIEELEELICGNIELGVHPSCAVKERCNEAMLKAEKYIDFR